MNKPQYLVSKGIVKLLRNRYGLELSDKVENRIDFLENEFTEMLGYELQNEFNYEVISANEIEQDMKDMLKQRDEPIITLDDVYFKDNKFDGEISITRLVQDVNNFDVKRIGPRKGSPELVDQVRDLIDKYKGQNVGLADIGIFEGETILSDEGIIKTLYDQGITVNKIYAPIINEPAKQKFKDRGIELITNKSYNFEGGDWLEVRDLLGLDGRKIDTNGFTTNNNTYLFARYIQDPMTLKKGANIQDGVSATIILDMCNMYQKKIFREIRKDKYQVTEGFINSDPRLYTLEFSDHHKND